MKVVPDDYDTFGEYVANGFKVIEFKYIQENPEERAAAYIADSEYLNTLATCSTSKVHDAPVLDPQPMYPAAFLILKDCLLFLLLLLELFSSL
jgi:hypothetical protein